MLFFSSALYVMQNHNAFRVERIRFFSIVKNEEIMLFFVVLDIKNQSFRQENDIFVLFRRTSDEFYNVFGAFEPFLLTPRSRHPTPNSPDENMT